MKLNIKLTARGETIAVNNLKQEAVSKLDSLVIEDVPMWFYGKLWTLKRLQGRTNNFFVKADTTKYRSQARAMKALDKMMYDYRLG